MSAESREQSAIEFHELVPSCCCSCSLGVMTHVTSQVISVGFYIKRGKSDKFCSKSLISV